MNSTWWVKPEQLDAAQRAVVSLSRRASHAVLGPPGSGKTNLLLLRAKHLTLANEPDFQILVFTRTLQEFLRNGAREYGIPIERIATSRRWLLEILSEYGVRPNLDGTFSQQRDSIATAMESLIASRGLKNRVGVLLLDETQDYTPQELALFSRLAKYLFVVGDIRQKIYDGPNPMDAIVSATGEPKVLEHHYRSGPAICELADAVAAKDKDFRAMSGSCNYKEEVFGKCIVNRETCPSLDDQVNRAIARLRTQLKAFQDELLGVICPKNMEAQQVWKAIEASDLGRHAVYQSQQDGYVAFSPKHRICVSTVHSAKGLEFRAVHFLAAESGKTFRERARTTYYTAITRGRTALSIYHTNNLPSSLEQALVSQSGRRSEPTIAQLFGKGNT